MDELIERARAAAQHSREYGPGTNAPLLDELAAALEAAREDSTSTATSPDQILLDAIEREIRQLEGKGGWLPQATRIANLRAAIDQARGKDGQDEA